MIIRKLRPVQPQPVIIPRTPRCTAVTKVQTEHVRRWRARQQGTAEYDPLVFTCTFPSVVEIDGEPFCRRHAGELCLDMYLSGRLVQPPPPPPDESVEAKRERFRREYGE